jgi:hypothetical protein
MNERPLKTHKEGRWAGCKERTYCRYLFFGLAMRNTRSARNK